MKETGIVRRLDDLGRLVIPKEIRKMYKMKEGDSIEIYIANNTICIRKYDETSSFYEQIEKMCEILHTKYGNHIFFTSEEYIARTGNKIEQKIVEKAQVHRSEFFENVKVYKEEETRYRGFIAPVVNNGNYYGSFVMVFNEREYSEELLESMKMFAQLLATQQH